MDKYKKAIFINPNSYYAYCNLGYYYGVQGMHDEAIVAFKKAISINPNNAYSYYSLAVALEYKKQYLLAKREIIKYFEVIKNDPSQKDIKTFESANSMFKRLENKF